MTRVVVIEDDSDLREALEHGLRGAGHDVVTASTGASGLRQASECGPSLVVLDLMLPDLSGLEVCKMLAHGAATKDVPVIILTGRSSEADRVAGFEAGAVDYVVKPFSMRELILRIAVALRRSIVASDDRETVECGAIVVDRRAERVWVDGRRTVLSPVELRLLLALYDHGGGMCSRGWLLAEVWGLPEDAATRTVDTHIKRLRGKLGRAGRRIETVRGVGYRLPCSDLEAHRVPPHRDGGGNVPGGTGA